MITILNWNYVLPDPVADPDDIPKMCSPAGYYSTDSVDLSCCHQCSLERASVPRSLLLTPEVCQLSTGNCNRKNTVSSLSRCLNFESS